MFDINEVKVGFLGFGNMAQAIAKGWLYKETLAPSQIYASERNFRKLEASSSKLNIQACQSNEELVRQVDVVILAVKPHQLQDLLAGLEDLLADKVVVSIAVGVLFDQLKDMLAPGTAHISMLPNTPIAVGQGAISLEAEHALSVDGLAIVMQLFEDVAQVTTVSSQQMAVAGVVNGCGPAFTALYIEAMADAAVKYGLDRQEAYQLVSQTIQGTAQLQLQTGDHPAAMKDAVTSPGGTTIKGVAALEAQAFRSAVIQAFDAILG